MANKPTHLLIEINDLNDSKKEFLNMYFKNAKQLSLDEESIEAMMRKAYPLHNSNYYEKKGYTKALKDLINK
jgi:hypothetical protein